MTYKIKLENANESFLKEIQELANKANVKLRLLNNEAVKIPTDRLQKAFIESENILKHPESYKSYKSMSDIKEYLES